MESPREFTLSCKVLNLSRTLIHCRLTAKLFNSSISGDFQHEFLGELFLDLPILYGASLSPFGNDHTTDSLGGVPCVENESVGLIHGGPCLHFQLFDSCIFISDCASDNF